MRCLIFNTREIVFVTGDPATLPSDIINVEPEIDNIKFENITICFTCIEEYDTQNDADIIISELIEYYFNHKLPLMIIPFGHLSSNIQDDGEISYALIKYIHNELVRINISIDQESGFGYDRGFILKWATLLHKTNVAFRDSKAICRR
jgi:hypothetical protein